MGKFLSRRLDENAPEQLSKYVRHLIVKEEENEKDIIMKKKINTILEEYDVPIKFFTAVTYKTWDVNDYKKYIEKPMTFDKICYYCAHNVKNISFYEKILKVIDLEYYKCLIRAICNKYCNKHHYIHLKCNVSKIISDELVLKLVINDEKYDGSHDNKIWDNYKRHVNNIKYVEKDFLYKLNENLLY